jgi:glucose-1-phosphate adenylyltransferase
MLAEGCVLQRSEIRASVIGLRTIIGPDVHISRTILMGADFYETPERLVENRRLGRPGVGIGRGSIIDSAIIDKSARIGHGVTVRAQQAVQAPPENDNWAIRDGIVVVPKGAVIPPGTVI